MAKIYLAKVLNLLGGFRNESEYNDALQAFESGLTPAQAVNRILNNR